MAITPKAAIGNKYELEKMHIDALEKRIDGALQKDYDGRISILIDVSSSSDFVVRAIICRFERAGWAVSREKGDNQRDGSWDNLVFSER